MYHTSVSALCQYRSQVRYEQTDLFSASNTSPHQTCKEQGMTGA